jgi:hypothetical protein
MQDKKDFNSTNGSKGKTQELIQKNIYIPPGAWMSVCCECCVLSGRGICDELVPRPEESYRVWCVSNVCDHETSMKRGGPGPCRAVEPYKEKKKPKYFSKQLSMELTLYCAGYESIQLM